MHRFFIRPSHAHGPVVSLDSAETHHAIDVLRLRAGDRVVALDGAGNELLCELAEISKRQVLLKVLRRQPVSPLPYQITLAQAVPKGKSMEWIVQKATELGAARIVPLISERSVFRITPEESAGKRDKWEQTAIEALKQCGSPWLPRIDPPVSPLKFLQAQEQFDLSFVGSLQPDARHPREYFTNYQQEHRSAPRSICLWVGPEGDFTPAELGAIKSQGALPVKLGPLVLRSETAALVCLAIAGYELQAK